ncbi:MAG: ribonuclease H-like domain-containing protein, partial [bacterium]
HIASLAGLPGVSLARDLVQKVKEREQERDAFLSTLGGDEYETETGPFWVRRRLYSLDRLPYKVWDIDGETISRLGRDESLRVLDPSRTIFIDTETTGLAGGTGTYPFLVGVGRFVDEGFAVTQYLMRDYDEELAMLGGLAADLHSASALVSFNGKCFDVPLLSTRFRMNRCPQVVDSLLHFDLLHPARRLWRHRCESCALLNLESLLLEHRREVDVPGSQIPQIYFDFVRGLRIDRMRTVLEHNLEDIRSLAMMTAKACRLYRSPESEASHPLDWFNLGRSFMGDRDSERACLCLKRSLESDLPAELRWTAMRDYSLLLKRAKDYAGATHVWLDMFEDSDRFHPFPYEELAKYYEHVAREPQRALVLVKDALKNLESLSSQIYDRTEVPFRIEFVRKDFMFRLKRLMRKVDTA